MNWSPIWWVLFSCWILSEIWIAVALRTKVSHSNVQDRGTQPMLWIVITIAVTSGNTIRATAANMFGRAHWLVVFGIVVMSIGLCIRWTAVHTLGQSFSANVAILEGQTICRSGLYRFVRHPSYLGLLLILLAIGVHSQNWISFLLVLVPTTISLLYRIRIEESALKQAFGNRYVMYARATYRLVPGVY